jgi:hypothetical protein
LLVAIVFGDALFPFCIPLLLKLLAAEVEEELDVCCGNSAESVFVSVRYASGEPSPSTYENELGTNSNGGHIWVIILATIAL